METTILDKRLIGAVTLRSVVTFVVSIYAGRGQRPGGKSL